MNLFGFQRVRQHCSCMVDARKRAAADAGFPEAKQRARARSGRHADFEVGVVVQRQVHRCHDGGYVERLVSAR